MLATTESLYVLIQGNKMAKRQLDRHETEGGRQQCKNPTENKANYFAEVYLSLMTKRMWRRCW
jgi:hypothetical protein